MRIKAIPFLTKFVPWAAYIQATDGKPLVMEQKELYDALCAQDRVNKDQIDVEGASKAMAAYPEVKVDPDWL